MIKNKIFDEYLEKEYDKNENYNNIYSKIKNDSKKRVLNLVATLFTVITIGTSASIIYANRNNNFRRTKKKRCISNNKPRKQ